MELARSRVTRAEAAHEAPAGDELPLASPVERVLRIAKVNASLGANEVRAEHILLGLAGVDALLEYGVTPERLGEEVHRTLSAAVPGEGGAEAPPSDAG